MRRSDKPLGPPAAEVVLHSARMSLGQPRTQVVAVAPVAHVDAARVVRERRLALGHHEEPEVLVAVTEVRASTASPTLRTGFFNPWLGRRIRRRRLRSLMPSSRLSRVEPSEEIRRVIQRWLAAISDADADSALGRLSDEPGTVMIGTDPEEWWRGREIRAIWARQLEEHGGFAITLEGIDAWEEGTVGWASVRVALTLSGQTHDARVTHVLHLERGEWKVVQCHWSLSQPNEALGLTLTRTLEELERTIERDRPDLSSTLAADGTVTIVFTDVVDSTVLTSRLGDGAWREVLRRHDAVIADATTAHGGRVVETQGDGSMLAFSSARRAVACARAIQSEIDRVFADDSPPIRVRIGIHTGDAIHEADRFFGTTVNYAARVASQALGGEVLVSSLVRSLVAGSGIEFLEGREVDLKGLDGSHQLFAVDLT